MTVFQYGDRVEKVQGYPWTGTVQSVFTNRKGQTRVVVELWRGFDGDALHIFNAEQIRHVPFPGDEDVWTMHPATPS